MQKRMDKELQEMLTKPPQGIEVIPNDKDRLSWEVIVIGPADSPYAGGKFRLSVKFPENYPFKAPEFNFITPIFHPNISDKGEICQDMLGAKDWQPTRMVKATLELIVNILAAPNPDQSVNNQAMELYKNDKNKFNEHAKAETAKHAK